ncbi:hypothetical protein C8P64_0853 [Christiangramia gaetbulicola]|uniref:Outer membrane protein with beta-barrel domain n=1 Tax=Christiangramia gaetbulicola TaxID=703340 RepID=A0A2T6AM51_9FLAO|nr:hypothetical protein [Christiangramia gaetbulicola]PTX44870.1 hypothetical protein C8P64_0853 [Christiangramia gaetbulicola]
MKNLARCSLLVFLCLFGLNLSAQEETELEAEHERHEEHRHKNVISLGIGHAHINSGVENGEKQWLVLPSWMLDYNFWFTEKWAIGLHSDMIIETFEVEDEHSSESVIERENPIALVGALSFQPIEWLSLVAGGGVEYEANESFGLFRLGVEPHWEIHEKWEIFVNIGHDIKFDAYNTWNLSLGIGRGF